MSDSRTQMDLRFVNRNKAKAVLKLKEDAASIYNEEKHLIFAGWNPNEDKFLTCWVCQECGLSQAVLDDDGGGYETDGGCVRCG